MHASSILSQAIQPLRPGDGAKLALDRMDELKLAHLPVVSGGRLVGVVKDTVLMDAGEEGTKVERLMDTVEVPYVRDRQHLFDVVKLMMTRGLTMVPVLDMGGRYLGAISGQDALRRMAEVANVTEPGSVLVLEMNRNDYALQQIARIVEDEGARLLSVYCSDLPDSTRMEVTLKVNREDISAVLRGFERFGYTVHTTYQGSQAEDSLRERYEDVMRIIKM